MYSPITLSLYYLMIVSDRACFVDPHSHTVDGTPNSYPSVGLSGRWTAGYSHGSMLLQLLYVYQWPLAYRG
jgi:hypothetical protein